LMSVVSEVQISYASSGFIQVRENWKRSGNLSGQGKSGKFWGKILPFCTAVVMLIIVELESNAPYC